MPIRATRTGTTMVLPYVSFLVVCACAWLIGLAAADQPAADLARSILDATGVKGGLVVHVGCGNGRLTAKLAAGDSYLVHGLDSKPANVDKARKHIRSAGLYGRASVDLWEGARLPYTDNLVNLLVSEGPDMVADEEIRRVLAPAGAAYIGDGREGRARRFLDLQPAARGPEQTVPPAGPSRRRAGMLGRLAK